MGGGVSIEDETTKKCGYTFDQKIGSQGNCHIVTNILTNTQNTAKTYPILSLVQYSDGRDIYDFLNQEIAFLHNFRYHQFLVKYNDVIIINELLIFICDYYKNGNLNDYIKFYGNPGLNDVTLKFFVRCILSGLLHLHYYGTVHCNLKLDNIYYDRSNGNLYIGEYGLSSVIRNSKNKLNCYPIINNEYYKAPEILHNKSDYSTYSDIWSVGMILLELFSGKQMVNKNEISSLNDKVSQLSKTSPTFTEFVMIFLREDPSMRLIETIRDHKYLNDDLTDLEMDDNLNQNLQYTFRTKPDLLNYIQKLSDNYDNNTFEYHGDLSLQSQNFFVNLSLSFFSIGHLKIINLENCMIQKEGMIALSLVINQFIELEELNVNNNLIEFQGLHFLVEKFDRLTSLKKLYLGSNDIGPLGVMSLISKLDKISDLMALDLSNNNIDDKSMVCFTLYLNSISSLELLDVKDNRIGDEGLKYLASNLIYVSNLRYLYINHNHYKQDSFLSLCENIIFLTELEILDISNNYIGPPCMKYLSEKFCLLTNVKSLNFENIHMEVEGLQYFTEYMLLTNLISLNLGCNQLGSIGTKIIAEGFCYLNSLLYLNLSDNSIDYDGVVSLYDNFVYLSMLISLDLSKNCIGSDGLDLLSESLLKLLQLQELSVMRNNIDTNRLLKFKHTFTDIIIN